MSKTSTSHPDAGPTDLPSWSWTWNAPAEDLESMLATDDDSVDTAIIPTLAYREAVEEAAIAGTAAATAPTKGKAKNKASKRSSAPAPKAKTAAPAKAPVELKSAPATPATVTPATVKAAPVEAKPAEAAVEAAPAPERTKPVIAANLRSRHATPESKAAIRRNLIAVCSVAVSIVIIGLAVSLVGGWIALAAYSLLVLVAGMVLRRVNARYAPRHSLYSPRHA